MVLILLLAGFAIGALPLIFIIVLALTGQNLTRIGTGNISVSAAFYHGGTIVGILAVVSEALKGIVVIELGQRWFPEQPALHLAALCFLVLGRYFVAKSAGTTNAVWGIIAYRWRVAFFVLLISGGFFLVDRDRNRSKYLVLFLLP
ncbi:MAG: glycerol-3-phosphate acyltransferase, partial [Cyanobacteria bacterium P01_F01_bin.42]